MNDRAAEALASTLLLEGPRPTPEGSTAGSVEARAGRGKARRR